MKGLGNGASHSETKATYIEFLCRCEISLDPKG